MRNLATFQNFQKNHRLLVWVNDEYNEFCVMKFFSHIAPTITARLATLCGVLMFVLYKHVLQNHYQYPLAEFVNHNVKRLVWNFIGWAYVIQAWAIRNLDSTRPAIRTADSNLAFSARRPPSCGCDCMWDVEELTTIDFYPTLSPLPSSRIERKQTTRKRTSGPIKIDLVVKPA